MAVTQQASGGMLRSVAETSLAITPVDDAMVIPLGNPVALHVNGPVPPDTDAVVL